jgi:protein required for attachment to host cells
MTTSWVVVAHRAGARFFEHRGPGKPLSRIESIDHPQGRFQDHDVGTDRPGLSGESAGSRHAMEPHETAHEHDARAFAKDLAHRLSAARQQHRMSRLVLVAEPHFLGYLEKELDKPTAALVTDRIHKDLANVADGAIDGHLGGALPTG